MTGKNYKLFYHTPAENTYNGWENEALPLGNGNLGAKVYGLVGQERIQYNEKSLWSGGPRPDDTKYNGGNYLNRYKYVIQIREALERGEVDQAKHLAETYLVGPENEQYGRYLAFGDILFEFPKEMAELESAHNYQRSLDLNTAVSYTEYLMFETQIKREVLTSYPDQVLAVHIEYQGEQPLEFSLSSVLTDDLLIIDSEQGLTKENAEATVYYSDESSKFKQASVEYTDTTALLSGSVVDNDLQFFSFLQVDTDGVSKTDNSKITIKEATYATVYLSAATDYAQDPLTNYRNDEDICSIVIENVHRAVNKGYQRVKNNHILDYQQLFNRVTLSLSDEPLDIPTDQLLANYKSSPNNYLEELFFQYGRYLLIASSRPGKNALPANLQGVWNAVDNPPWNSDYHLNVNLQMVYWPVFCANLSELADPLVDFVDDLRYYGRIAAKEYAGVVSTSQLGKGWLAHTQVTPFGWTTPGWDYYWGWSPTANAWIMQNVYDYYRYTKNYNLLKNKIYDMLRETAEFWNQNLHYDLKHDRYVSSPSFSPEHGTITIGNTFDQSLIWQIFYDFIEASYILGVSNELVDEVKSKINKLNPIQINQEGYIKEWFEEDQINFDPGYVDERHRHISHLVGLYPGGIFNEADEKTLEAAKKVLNKRGDGGTGWAKANKINLWARLLDGNRAHKILYEQLSESTLDNLWDTHPPFQLDGNMGALSGMCEMLVQSHKNKIHLLPTLPDSWQNGEVNGLLARGHFEVSMQWREGKLTSAIIESHSGGEIHIIYDDIVDYHLKSCSENRLINDDEVIIKTLPGDIIEIKSNNTF